MAETPQIDPQELVEQFRPLLVGYPDPMTMTHDQLLLVLAKIGADIMGKAQQAIDLEVGITDRMAETLSEMVLSRNGDLIGRVSGKPNAKARALALSVYAKHRKGCARKSAVSEVALGD